MIRSKIMGRKMIRRKIRQCLAFWKPKQKREKDGPGAYRLILLDLDETYGQEEADSYGVEPVLYLLRLLKKNRRKLGRVEAQL